LLRFAFASRVDGANLHASLHLSGSRVVATAKSLLLQTDKERYRRLACFAMLFNAILSHRWNIYRCWRSLSRPTPKINALISQ
jgi:hypothetical protein